jgi:hypothetical protein
LIHAFAGAAGVGDLPIGKLEGVAGGAIRGLGVLAGFLGDDQLGALRISLSFACCAVLWRAAWSASSDFRASIFAVSSAA